MKEAYDQTISFHAKSLKLITLCDTIVSEYVAQGFRLTIRQLYYQLVARGHVENTVQSYANVQGLMTKARMAGLIDWDAIEDRTRGFVDRPHWTSGGSILQAAAQSYWEDLWTEQETRVFVIVEKEALSGVLEPVCREYDLPLLAARGYPSASTLREFARERILHTTRCVVLLHLGDHDPSGIDMSRDLLERLEVFTYFGVELDFKRIALTMDQVNELKPPANPAKSTDARFESYRALYGEESWELDALSPNYIRDLIVNNVTPYIDQDAWQESQAKIARIRARLADLAATFKDDE
jgi:hypothetical protein